LFLLLLTVAVLQTTDGRRWFTARNGSFSPLWSLFHPLFFFQKSFSLLQTLSFVPLIFLCFSCLSSLLSLYFCPPFAHLSPFVFIRRKGGEGYYPCLVMAQG
jgi:hypothetical protein